MSTQVSVRQLRRAAAPRDRPFSTRYSAVRNTAVTPRWPGSCWLCSRVSGCADPLLNGLDQCLRGGSVDLPGQLGEDVRNRQAQESRPQQGPAHCGPEGGPHDSTDSTTDTREEQQAGLDRQRRGRHRRKESSDTGAAAPARAADQPLTSRALSSPDRPPS
jgi:hypothetical protein